MDKGGSDDIKQSSQGIGFMPRSLSLKHACTLHKILSHRIYETSGTTDLEKAKSPRRGRDKARKTQNKNYQFILLEETSRIMLPNAPPSQNMSSLTWLMRRKARLNSQPHAFALYGLPIPVLPNTYTLIKYLLTELSYKFPQVFV